MKTGVLVLTKIINGVVSIIQIIIGLGIILKLFGAKDVPFVRAVYTLETPLLSPFKGMFQPVALAPHYYLDLSALFALVVYSIAGYVIIKLIDLLRVH